MLCVCVYFTNINNGSTWILMWDHSNWSKDRKNGAHRMVDGELVEEDENSKIKQNVLIWKIDAPIHRFIRHIYVYEKSLQVERKWNWREKNIFFSFFKRRSLRLYFEIRLLIMIYVYRMRQSKRNRGSCHLFLACYFCFMAEIYRKQELSKQRARLL